MYLSISAILDMLPLLWRDFKKNKKKHGGRPIKG
jgi:hypothetical protein